MTSSRRKGKQIANSLDVYVYMRSDITPGSTRASRLRRHCRGRVNKRENKRLTRQRLTLTMVGPDYRGGARVSLFRRKEGTQLPDNGRLRNSHLIRQWLAGTFVFSCAMKSRYNETDHVEIRRLTSPLPTNAARFSISPPGSALAFRRRNEGPKREISPAAVGRCCG